MLSYKSLNKQKLTEKGDEAKESDKQWAEKIRKKQEEHYRAELLQLCGLCAYPLGLLAYLCVQVDMHIKLLLPW